MGQVIAPAMPGNKKVSEGARPKSCLIVGKWGAPSKDLSSTGQLSNFKWFQGDIN